MEAHGHYGFWISGGSELCRSLKDGWDNHLVNAEKLNNDGGWTFSTGLCRAVHSKNSSHYYVVINGWRLVVFHFSVAGYHS